MELPDISPSVSAPIRKSPRVRDSCDGCRLAKYRCSRDRPCTRCRYHKIKCIYSLSKRTGRPKRKREHAEEEGEQVKITSSLVDKMLSLEAGYTTTDPKDPFNMPTNSDHDQMFPGFLHEFCVMPDPLPIPTSLDHDLNYSKSPLGDTTGTDWFDSIQGPITIAGEFEPLSPISATEKSKTDTHRCGCHSYILRLLFEFETIRANTDSYLSSSSVLDTVLLMGQNAQEQLNRVLQCLGCSTTRPDLFLMLNPSIYHFISLLDQALSCANRQKRSDFFQSRPLHLGCVEIGAEEKSAFVRQLLLSRLHTLGTGLQLQKQRLDQTPDGIFRNMGLSMVDGIEGQLQMVIGKLEDPF
ncbi:hypothetical protein BJX70DRAFT_381194 [Aspergillus crustosus]